MASEAFKSIYKKFTGKGEKIEKSREAPSPEKPPLPIKPEKEKEEEKFAFEGSAATIARKEGQKNEDAFGIDSENGIYIVCDGMGGHAAGEVASQETKNVILKELGLMPAEDKNNSEKVKKTIEKAFEKAYINLCYLTKEKPEYKGMGTTVSAMMFVEGGKKLVTGQIGDSRIYRQREKKLERISPEDSYVETAIKYGLIESDQDVTKKVKISDVSRKYGEIIQKLSKTENEIEKEKFAKEAEELFDLLRMLDLIDKQSKMMAEKYNDKSLDFQKEVSIVEFRNVISKALGSEEGRSAAPKILTLDVRNGDRYLVSSDGIHDNLDNEEIHQIMEQCKNPEKTAKQLILKSQERAKDEFHPRAKEDDKTAIVVEVKKTSEIKKFEKEKNQ